MRTAATSSRFSQAMALPPPSPLDLVAAAASTLGCYPERHPQTDSQAGAAGTGMAARFSRGPPKPVEPDQLLHCGWGLGPRVPTSAGDSR